MILRLYRDGVSHFGVVARVKGMMEDLIRSNNMVIWMIAFYFLCCCVVDVELKSESRTILVIRFLLGVAISLSSLLYQIQ